MTESEVVPINNSSESPTDLQAAEPTISNQDIIIADEKKTIPINDSEETAETSKTLAKPEMVLEWRKQYLREGHTVCSSNSYYSFIKRFVDYGIEINQKSVNKFRTKNMSAVCAGGLKAFFRFLVDKKDFPQDILNIKFDKSKSMKKFPKSITSSEVYTLVEAMPGYKEKYLTMMLFEQALRISEGLKLKWEDFNWVQWLEDKSKYGTINLINTKRGKFRSIPVKPELMKTLYDAHAQRTQSGVPIGNLVFNFGIEAYLKNKANSLEQNQFDYTNAAANYMRGMIYRLSKSLLGKRVNPHQLRHAKAQELMDKGLPIESLKFFLGHDKITSTEIYAQASAEKLKRDFEKLDRGEALQ